MTQHNEGFVFGLGDIDGGAVGQALGDIGVLIGHQHDFLIFQQLVVQLSALGAGGNQRQVAHALDQQLLQHVAAVLVQFYAHIRILLRKLGNDQRQ